MGRPFQTNVADEKQIADARRIERRRVGRRQDLYRRQLATPDGRAFCWDLLEDVGIYASPYRAAGNETAFLCGEQNAGLKIRARLIDASEELYQLMETEARARAKRDDHEVAAVQTPAATDAEAT